MGFNSEGNVGWTRTASYLTKGEGSHTFSQQPAYVPYPRPGFRACLLILTSSFVRGGLRRNGGSCFPALHVSVSEEHFILKINGYRFAAATRTQFITCPSFFKSSPRCTATLI